MPAVCFIYRNGILGFDRDQLYDVIFKINSPPIQYRIIF